MQLMEEMVKHGCENDGNGYQENDTAEESVAAGKNFSIVVRKIANRTHARQNHRRVDIGIDPVHLGIMVVSYHPYSQRNSKQKNPKNGTSQKSSKKLIFFDYSLISFMF